MRFDDCASIVQKRKGTGDDAIDFSYKRICATGAFFTRIAGTFVLLRLPILPYALFSLLLGAGLYGIKFWKYGKDERLRERI